MKAEMSLFKFFGVWDLKIIKLKKNFSMNFKINLKFNFIKIKYI